MTKDNIREVVDMPLPSWQGVDFGHVTPDSANSGGTVAIARVDATRGQQLFLWEEGNVPAGRNSSSGSGHDPAAIPPAGVFQKPYIILEKAPNMRPFPI